MGHPWGRGVGLGFLALAPEIPAKTKRPIYIKLYIITSLKGDIDIYIT
jgi:hypothetical protein